MPLISCSTGSFNVAYNGQKDAPALLLSNSLTCDLSMWERVLPTLSTRFHVIRYDGRGQGGSVTTPGPYTMEQLGNDALSVLDASGIERAHVCGVSMGGMVGMWLATHVPHRIGRAVLANTAAFMGPSSLWDGRIALARQSGMQAVAAPTLARWFPPAFHASAADVVEAMRPAILATPVDGYVACCEAIRDMDQRDSIRSITTSTLVIVGANDTATTPADGQFIHEAIAGSCMVTLPAGHISAVETPEAFSQEVLAFLSA
jgi:3-oxoadipate enol-lactonase